MNRTRIKTLKEPFSEELERIRFEEFSKEALSFSYALESVSSQSKKTKILDSKSIVLLSKTENKFYSRYKVSKDSNSIGLVLTNIDLGRIGRYGNGEPIFWQMGRERRKLALAQRALFFDENHNPQIYKKLISFENGKTRVKERANRRSPTIEKALGMESPSDSAVYTPALTEIGYKKISTDKIVSRRKIVTSGLFNKIGKYPRKIIGLGAMPPVSGWRDTLVTSIVGHMLCFIPRSSVFASNLENRLRLALDVRKTIQKLPIKPIYRTKILRNLGAAIGAENPDDEVNIAKYLYEKAGITVFRIYTIGSDKRVIETAKKLRQKLGEKIEIFVGQIADKAQAERLIQKDILVDGLIFGHGGGQQCTSAINGMAITTLEDVYSMTTDKRFNNTSIILEGGVGRSIGVALVMGVDCVLGNQKFVRGTIETGNVFLEDKMGKICQPYPGTASPVTQIIESEDPTLRFRRADAAGRTYYSEGKPGLMFYEEKAGSMAFWINEHLRHAARTLADLGVENIEELRKFLSNDKREFLRILSEKTQYLSEAHRNSNF